MNQADVISTMNPSSPLDRFSSVTVKAYGVPAEASMLATTLKTLTRILYGPYKSTGENEDFVYPGL